MSTIQFLHPISMHFWTYLHLCYWQQTLATAYTLLQSSKNVPTVRDFAAFRQWFATYIVGQENLQFDQGGIEFITVYKLQ